MHSLTCKPRPLCPLCGSAGTLAQSGVPDPDGNLHGTWSFQHCTNPECEVFWLDPAPPADEMWKAYVTYHTHSKRTDKKASKALVSLVHRLLKLSLYPLWLTAGLVSEGRRLRLMTLANVEPGRLLDVGCGGGRFLNRMRKRGWQVEGIDFDEQAAQKVTARYGITAHTGDLVQCALPEASFDAITMSQTIEHLYDPAATLRECLRLLKPGGVLVMTTPNAHSVCANEFGAYWRGWEAPRHLQVFTVDSLSRLTRSTGLEVTEAHTSSYDSAGIYRASYTKQHARSLSLSKQLRLLVWSLRKEWQEHRQQKLHPYTGQNILIRARKPNP